MDKTTSILICSLLLAIMFAVIAGTFHGFVNEAVKAAPDIDSKNAKLFVGICTWLAVILVLVALGAAVLQFRRHKPKAASGVALPPPAEPLDA